MHLIVGWGSQAKRFPSNPDIMKGRSEGAGLGKAQIPMCPYVN
jgi:hypothetical protein